MHVHPLILANISDHYTRVSVENTKPLVIGAIFGIQQGLDVSFMDCFEVLYGTTPSIQVDVAYLTARKEQCTSTLINMKSNRSNTP